MLRRRHEFARIDPSFRPMLAFSDNVGYGNRVMICVLATCHVHAPTVGPDCCLFGVSESYLGVRSRAPFSCHDGASAYIDTLLAATCPPVENTCSTRYYTVPVAVRLPVPRIRQHRKKPPPSRRVEFRRKIKQSVVYIILRAHGGGFGKHSELSTAIS